MSHTKEIFATLMLTFVLGFYPNMVQATTFNQGTRHTDITPQGGVAVSDNGGNATTSDNSVAVSHGKGAQSDASDHSTAVSTAQDNSQSVSIATDHSTANSNANDNSVARSTARTHSTTNSDANDNSVAISGGTKHVIADATASEHTIAVAITHHPILVRHTP